MTDCITVGALRKVAKLIADGVAVHDALNQVADEIQDGMEAYWRGDTRELRVSQAYEGIFMGDKKKEGE